MPAPDAAEVAGTLEYDVFVEVVRLVDRPVDAKTRQPVGRSRIDVADERAERKEVLVGDNAACGAGIDDPDLDGGVEQPSHRQKLHFEVGLLAAPDRLVGAETDVAELIVGELPERRRHRIGGLGERPRRQILGKLLHEACWKARGRIEIRTCKRLRA